MQHLPELLKIIEGGMRQKASQVLSFANLLADKLEKEGEKREADRIRKALSKLIQGSAKGEFSLSDAGNIKSVALPVDNDSRLSLVDESAFGLGEITIELPNEIRGIVCEFINFVQKKDLLVEAGVGVSPSLLIYGPPGCGKTHLARYLSSELELPLLTARCDTLVSSFLGSTAKNIRKLFDHASERPCILFLDEFDALAKARDDQHELGELKRVVVSLLQNIDSLPDDTVLLAATNHEQLLDTAVWRRFAYKLEVPLPSTEIRENLIKNFLGKYAPKSLKSLVSITDGLSGAAIKQACESAIRSALVAGESKVDEEEIVIRLAKSQYRQLLSADESKESKIKYLKDQNQKVFTVRLLAKMFDVSTGKISQILNQ